MSRHRTLPDVPPHYREIKQMLECAFPDGLPEHTYWSLMILLGERLSFRSLASLMALIFNKEYGEVHHDAMIASSRSRPEPSELDAVKARLQRCGYMEWLAQEG